MPENKKITTKRLEISSDHVSFEIEIRLRNGKTIAKARLPNQETFSIFLYLLGRGLQRLGFEKHGTTGCGTSNDATFKSNQPVDIPLKFIGIHFATVGKFD